MPYGSWMVDALFGYCFLRLLSAVSVLRCKRDTSESLGAGNQED
jgi:hypothetical protein